jgi:integrase
MKLTKDEIANLKLKGKEKDKIYFDEEIPGFGIRIRVGGKRTWVVQYRHGGETRRISLGSVKVLGPEMARKAAKERLAEVTLGRDPQREKAEARANAETILGSVVGAYLKFKEKTVRESTFAETRRYLTEHWKTLNRLPIQEVARRNVAMRLNEISEQNGSVAAARARVALSGMFTWAVREGIAETNPVVSTNKPREPQSRDRVLTDAELAEIWASLRDDDYGRIVKLALLTGARREEIGGLTWQELDLDRVELNLGPQRTKNGRPLLIPLSHIALSIIRAVPRREGREHLFGEGAGAFSGWSKAKTALDRRIVERRKALARAAGRANKGAQPLPAWRFHDLRRTVATRMADLGIQPHIIEACLNHVSGSKAGVAGVYNRSLYVAEKRAALEKWGRHIQTIIGADEGSRI